MTKLTRCLPALLALVLVALATGGCTKELRKNRHLARGQRYFEAQQYDLAEIEYLKVLQVSPLNPTAIGHLGIIYQEQGKLPRAYTYLKKAVELDPENVQVRIKLSLVYFALRGFKEAADEANWVLKKQPGQEDALEVLASCPTNLKANEDTQQQIQKWISTDKDRAAYHVALGFLALRRQDSTNAEPEFKKALELDSKSGTAMIGLGTICWSRADLQQAEQLFKSSAEVSPPHSPRRLKYAEFKQLTGATDEAKKSLEEITRQTPDYLPAWNLLAQIAFSEKKYDDCNSFLQRVLAREPADSDALSMSGNVKLAKGQMTEAITDFTRLTTDYPKLPQAHYQLARAEFLSGDFAQTSTSLNRALALDPEYPDAVLLRAELDIRRGDLSPAITSLNAMVKKHPGIFQAHLLLASAYLSQKNYDGALSVYRQMTALFPKSPQVPWLAGLVLSQQRKNTEAREAAKQALERSPDFTPALELLADLDIADKQPDRALEMVQKEVDRRPGVVELQALLAKVLMMEKKLDQAEPVLHKVIEMSPDSRDGYLGLAELYVSENKQQQALEPLNQFVAKTNDVVVLLQIGMLQESLKNYPAARDAYERLLTTDPNAATALNNLAFIYSDRLGDLNKAYQLAEKAQRLAPENPSVADTFGWILYERGDYQRALPLLEQAAAKLSSQAEIQFHLGMDSYALGAEPSALAALQRAVQGGDFPRKDEARQRLALLQIDPAHADAAARAIIEKQVQQNPNDGIALARLGAIQERDGTIDKAVESYQAALKCSPRNSQLMLKLAQIYGTPPNNDAQKALGMAKKAHDAAPDDPRISALLGRLVYQSGDYKWAASLLEESGQKLGNDPAVSYDLAWAYYSVGRVSDALGAMQVASQSAAAFGKSEEAGRFIALVSAASDPSRAAQMSADIQTSLSKNPNYLPALVLSGLIQENQGNFKQAAQAYEQILGRYPLFAPITRNLALLYFTRLGEDQKAYDLATKAREAFPQDADLAKALGVLNYRKANYARAVQLLKESARSRPTDGEVLYYLGMAQYRLKSTSESKQSLNRALELKLPPELDQDARKTLNEIK